MHIEEFIQLLGGLLGIHSVQPQAGGISFRPKLALKIEEENMIGVQGDRCCFAYMCLG